MKIATNRERSKSAPRQMKFSSKSQCRKGRPFSQLLRKLSSVSHEQSINQEVIFGIRKTVFLNRKLQKIVQNFLSIVGPASAGFEYM